LSICAGVSTASETRAPRKVSCFTRPVRHRHETGLLRLLRGCIQGVMIDPGARERSQPIVRVAIELDQLEMRLDQLDRRHELRTLQPVFVKRVGMLVRCGHQSHAAAQQPFEQAAHQHRIADIRDVKLIQT